MFLVFSFFEKHLKKTFKTVDSKITIDLMNCFVKSENNFWRIN